MMKFFPVALVFFCLVAPVHGAVYKCVDSRGNVTYTNDRQSAKNCNAIRSDLPVSSIPAYKGKAGRGSQSNLFQNVDRETQRNRDTNRQQLLRAELIEEEKALSMAKSELAKMQDRLGDQQDNEVSLSELQPYQSKVEQHQRNVDALHKEIIGGGGSVPVVRESAPPPPAPPAAAVRPLDVEPAPTGETVKALPSTD